MKTLKSLFIITILVAFSNIKANNGGNVSTRDLSEKVKRAIITPESIKEKHRSEKITVYFVVNEKGQVIEVNAKTSDKKAKQDLENQFMRLTFEGLNPCVNNCIDINFLSL